MKFLIDSNLSPALATALQEAGHDAVHTREVGRQHAKDRELFEFARDEDRIIISSDTDFATIIIRFGTRSPSLILLRATIYRPEQQALLLLNRLPELTEALTQGAIVTFERSRIRIRLLPLQAEE